MTTRTLAAGAAAVFGVAIRLAGGAVTRNTNDYHRNTTRRT